MHGKLQVYSSHVQRCIQGPEGVYSCSSSITACVFSAGAKLSDHVGSHSQRRNVVCQMMSFYRKNRYALQMVFIAESKKKHSSYGLLQYFVQ